MAKEQAIKYVTAPHVVCFPKLLKAEAFKDGQKKEFMIEVLIPEDHKDVDAILDIIDDIYEAEKNGIFKGVKMGSKKWHSPLKHWEEVLEDQPKRNADEIEGHYVLKAKTTRKPVVYTEDGDVMEDYEVEDLIYSGAVCRIAVGLKGFEWESSTYGISCFLNSVKYWDEGERMGGFSASHDDYEDETPKRGKREEPSSRRRGRASEPEEEDEEPRGRRRSRREEPEEAPRRRSRGRASEPEEEDEPAPRRRSRRSEPEEEDEPAPRGRTRSRSRREDDEDDLPF